MPEPAEQSEPDDAGEQDPPDAVTGASSADSGQSDAGQPDGGGSDAGGAARTLALAGRGGAKLETRALAYDASSGADGYDFAVDQPISSGAPGAVAASQSPVLGKWYDYNATTHVVSPGDRTYLVRGARAS